MNPSPSASHPVRVASVDALRGFVMFTMIFVNDLAGVSANVVPWWMRHFKADGNGMTFVDLVFPAFLFTVGLSIPLALGPRRERGEPLGRTLRHLVIRTLSLLWIGILMVHEIPDGARLGWSGPLWAVLVYVGAILAFARWPGPPALSRALSGLGFGLLVFLTFSFRGTDGHRILQLQPFALHTSWYGILGLIGWAYFVAALAYLGFGDRPVAMLGTTALLMCLYPAARLGAFDHFWLNRVVGIGSTLGSLTAISTAGVLLAIAVFRGSSVTAAERVRFTLLFSAGCVAAALLLHPLYGINKNSGTPSWCFWACAISALLWLGFHRALDRTPPRLPLGFLATAGNNVLLAYLLSNLFPTLLEFLGLAGAYGKLGDACLACAIGRSLLCATVILGGASLLNRAGLRLKL